MTRAGTSPCCAFDRGMSFGSDLPASVSLGVPPLVGLFLRPSGGKDILIPKQILIRALD